MGDVSYLKFEFTGYVNKVMVGKFGKEIICRTAKDESDIKYPQRALFSASKKNEDKVPETLKENDKVAIQFMPILAEGVSPRTHREYAINKLMLQSCEILEVAPEPAEDNSESVEDLPF